MVSSASRAHRDGLPAGPGARLARLRRDTGAVLVETAVAIPLLLVLVITLAWVLGAVAAKNQTTELAHAVAAQAARGAVEDIERLRAEAGRESLIDISVDGDLIRVTVRRSVPVPGPVLDGLSLDVTSSALALREM